jgi:hypothetical protein
MAAPVALALALGHGAAATTGCGESRLPIGEECLRDEDCLSNVCSARTCVPAPQLTVPYGGTPDQEPRIPDAAAADAKSIVDAATDR